MLDHVTWFRQAALRFADGERTVYVDPWGTPLKIYFGKNEVLIRSAGPNKTFEDTKAALTDDYYRSD